MQPRLSMTNTLIMYVTFGLSSYGASMSKLWWDLMSAFCVYFISPTGVILNIFQSLSTWWPKLEINTGNCLIWGSHSDDYGNTLFWDVTPCNLVKFHQCSGGWTSSLFLAHCLRSIHSTLKLKAARSYDTLVNFYQTTWSHSQKAITLETQTALFKNNLDVYIVIINLIFSQWWLWIILSFGI